jgi:flavin reductase (DIM6/NTAB) family NADH-FMN oxidoreductase RutF
MTAAPTELQRLFRSAMSRVCAPVSVVTTVEDGRPHGTTVSSFFSLSMTPPMVLVSLAIGSDLLATVRRTGIFGLNILAAGQSVIALRCAGKGPDKLHGIDWSEECGVVRLPGVAAWVACTVRRIVEGGDHLLVLGDIVAAEANEVAPLTYHARTFGTHLRAGR